MRWATTVIALAAIASFVIPIAASAKGASEPAVAGQSWYWKDQQHQEIQDPVGDTYTIEGPNPFCPLLPGDLGAVPGPVCAPGRLPIEIHAGDYDEPNKMSAVNFDFSLVPIGAKVSKFKVTFLESKPGCYDTNDDGQIGQNDRCERTDPVNLSETTKLQACQVNEFFGSGSARLYTEAPKYKCTDADPVAERKEAKVKGAEEPLNDDTPDHVWTFDLTSLAKKWTSGTTQTSIMLVGNPPKNYNPDDKDEKDSWRVVLVGPQSPQGIVTSLQYTPPATPPPAPTDTTGTTGTTTVGTDTGFSSGSTDFSSGTSSGGTDFGSGTDTAATTDDTGSETTGDTAPTAAAAPGEEPNGFPAYMWLAILAGIIGFSLVRSVVIESTTGVRPNGVIAQIKSLNAQRKGGAAEGAAAGGALTGVGSALGSVGHGFSTFAGKVKSLFKRG